MHYGTVATFNHATTDKVPDSNVRRIVDAVPIVAEVAVNVRNPSASLVLVGFCLGYRLVDLPFLDQTSQLFSYLRGMRTLMRCGAPDPVLAERCLSGMSAELDKAGAIIDRVRSYAREGARRDLPVDLPALLSECLADMTKSDRLKVPVAADIRPGLIVSGDAVELRVLVINLVKNAQEAILSAPEPAQASGGRPYGLFITLDAADEGTAVRLTVANTGALLTPEALAEIGRPLASSKSSGLGLGLMICKSIAEAHLATLAFSARTARDGGGLAVTLTMPARSEAPLHENYGNLP